MPDALFAVTDLHLSLPDMTKKPLFGAAPRIEILKGLNFAIAEGEITGIVGESGSGKTSLGRTLIRLLKPDSGTIHFAGRDIAAIGDDEMRPLRRDLQIIFQDPFSSLDPRVPIGESIGEGLIIHGMSKQERSQRAGAGIRPAGRRHHRLTASAAQSSQGRVRSPRTRPGSPHASRAAGEFRIALSA